MSKEKILKYLQSNALYLRNHFPTLIDARFEQKPIRMVLVFTSKVPEGAEEFIKKLDFKTELVVGELDENLTFTDQHKTLVKSSTKNMEAYNLYLKSSHFWKKWTPHDIRKSLEYLEQAIQLDNSFAKAYSALSGCYVYLGAFGQIPSTLAYPKAKEYAKKAIQIDDSLPESHLSIAMVEFFDWNWDDAYKSFIKTLELNPNSAEAHQYFAYYMIAGRSAIVRLINTVGFALSIVTLLLIFVSNM